MKPHTSTHTTSFQRQNVISTLKQRLKDVMYCLLGPWEFEYRVLTLVCVCERVILFSLPQQNPFINSYNTNNNIKQWFLQVYSKVPNLTSLEIETESAASSWCGCLGNDAMPTTTTDSDCIPSEREGSLLWILSLVKWLFYFIEC